MNLHQQKRVIGLAAAFVGLGGGAVLMVGLSLPVQSKTYEPETPVRPAGTAAPAETAGVRETGTSLPPLAELQRLGAMDLRKPLYGSSSVGEVGPTSPPASPMAVRLVGTINERGHSMGIFQKQDGSIEVCAQGRSFDDAGAVIRIVKVEDQKVTVQHAGGSCELVIAPTP